MRYTIEIINRELEKEGWKCLSEEYKNLDTELVFECEEGHKVYSTWRKIRKKRECPVCASNKFKEEDIKVIPKEKDKKRILALDQATRLTGWSIFDDCALTTFGVFETQLSEEIQRDNAIKNWLLSMIEMWQIDEVALEGLQYQKNFGVTTFETLARLQGILMEACYERDIPFQIFHTNTWRAHCKVKGKSRVDKKRSMQLLIKEWYDITVTDDVADAIGIGKYMSEVASKKFDIIDWE